MQQVIDFDVDLIQKYNTSGPRYTSYPTAVEFDKSFTLADYYQQIELSNKQNNPLSLYFHIPFCDTVCYYCACNKIITKNRDHATAYLNNLHKEIAMQAALFNKNKQVQQLHWGGGTPTFIDHQQMRDLMQVTRDNFNLASDDEGEYSIEIDPREADANTIALLRELGFNRLSIGVQDIEPNVQLAVNRIQTKQQTLSAVNAARHNGFKSISIDLIYGLPQQTQTSFAKTIEHIIDIDPDRISLFNYAHMPERFKVQRQIKQDQLPSASTKLAILQQSIKALTQAGYVYIGMDHFAKPDDSLAVAQRENKLYRNFQGYSTHADCDLIGLGMTSIGNVNDCYAQNQRTLADYNLKLENNQLAIAQGFTLSNDDKLRRTIISQLICHFELDLKLVEKNFNITFSDYFELELQLLDPFIEDGLLYIQKSKIHITPVGRLLIRNICMIFDRYLREKSQNQFSKVI
jgi:oxygen-independent coproporphyrinogen-3 oxidase